MPAITLENTTNICNLADKVVELGRKDRFLGAPFRYDIGHALRHLHDSNDLMEDLLNVAYEYGRLFDTDDRWMKLSARSFYKSILKEAIYNGCYCAPLYGSLAEYLDNQDYGTTLHHRHASRTQPGV